MSIMPRPNIRVLCFSAERAAVAVVPKKPPFPWMNRYKGSDPTYIESVVVNAPANFICRRGGYLLPDAIDLPTDEIPEYWPIVETGVHTNALFLGYDPLLRQLCDELRERTLPEVCAFIVGTVKVCPRKLVVDLGWWRFGA